MLSDNELNYIQSILHECAEIQTFAEDTSADGDPVLLEQRLTYINSYLARCGKLWADVCKLIDRETIAVFNENLDIILKMPTTLANKFIQAKNYELNYVAKWLERLNREFVHQGDNIRTQVSMQKEQLKMTYGSRN